MPYYEVTYETGRVSVASYANDDEAKSALGEHHRRATSGEAGGPLGAPAERVVAVRSYKVHPNEYNPDQTMSGDVLKSEVGGLIDALADENGVVDVSRVAVEVRGLTHPMTVPEKPFDSIFKMPEDKSLKLDFLGG